jgi:nitrogen fixation/metabolism regulation signal transduction histidine kinase
VCVRGRDFPARRELMAGRAKESAMRNGMASPGKRVPLNAQPGKLAIERGLAQAFVTFIQAAGSLEKCYTLLQNEVGRLREELWKANAELDQSLQENARMRGYLTQVLENLPCGVVVFGGTTPRVQILNPQTRRLLQIPPEWQESTANTRPEQLEKLLATETGEKETREQEWPEDGRPGGRTMAVTSGRLNGAGLSGKDRIWILRETTEQKRLAAERERAQQALALTEITTLLAHEIRNPASGNERRR